MKSAGLQRFVRLKFGGKPPECPLPLLVEHLLPYIRLAELKGAKTIIVLVDREWREQCAPALANDIAEEMVRQNPRYSTDRTGPGVRVVCPDHCLENWLIADPDAFATHAYIARKVAHKVGSKADCKPALDIIKWAFRKGLTYHKAKDAPRLAAVVRVLDPTVRRRSKSLDKFLREAGVPPVS